MKKIISILSTLSLSTTLTLPLISCKQNKLLTYLDRDITLITCNKNEKIGMINIRYWTNDEPNIKKTPYYYDVLQNLKDENLEMMYLMHHLIYSMGNLKIKWI